MAKRVLERVDNTRGYCLVLGSGNGHLAYEISERSDFQVIGVEEDPAKVATSRRALEAAGSYGRVAIHECDPMDRLPYTDFLFNLVVYDSLEHEEAFSGEREEVERVLRPYGGAAILGPEEDQVLQRGSLQRAGAWTHMYADPANTACSIDERVRGRMQLQWFGRPGPRQMIDRHHRTVAPLWCNGRLFVPGNDRVIAVDAYNGTLLWNVTFRNSRRVGAFRDCSYMVATDDLLYVAAEDRCYEVEADTGIVQRSIGLPDSVPDQKREWGYLGAVDDLLFGSAVKPQASRRDHGRAQIEEGTYYDFRPLVCSECLFAVDRTRGKAKWVYRPPSGIIINSTITIGDGIVYFVESTARETTTRPDGRVPLSELVGKGANIVALRVRDGTTSWSMSHDLSAIQHALYVSYSQEKLVVVGSRNHRNPDEQPGVYYELHVFDALTGKPAWTTTQAQGTQIGGSHGEQDHHPVIVEDRLVCEPYAYELHTGNPLPDWEWQKAHRRGCGTISASASTLFFRQANPTMFDLPTNRYSKVTTVTRPGCWINMIPAGGLLLIPEASSGCTCNFAIQTSLAFLPSESPEKAD
jgi:outer membrane protein assembly factor BamB